jgi:hypothetical protein
MFGFSRCNSTQGLKPDLYLSIGGTAKAMP